MDNEYKYLVDDHKVSFSISLIKKDHSEEYNDFIVIGNSPDAEDFISDVEVSENDLLAKAIEPLPFGEHHIYCEGLIITINEKESHLILTYIDIYTMVVYE